MDRLDTIIVKKGLLESRTRAKYEIENGNVFVNGKVETKPSIKVSEEDNIEIHGEFKYVSRGALKLLKAVETFNIILKDKTMLDIGSSTGGFSEVALEHGIKKVIAVDVGANQFHEKLKNNNRIELHEGTDIRDFVTDENIDIVTIDISFISVSKIINKLNEFNGLNEILLLIKPQFECGKEIADKYKGIPLNKEIHFNIVNRLIEEFKKIGFNIQNLTSSPIKGGSGNIEYLAYFTKDEIKIININRIINEAFK